MAVAGTWLAWTPAAAAFLPATVIAGGPVHAGPLEIGVAMALGIMAALAAWWASAGSLPAACAGAAGLVAACWLLSWASYPGSGWILAALAGGSAGALLPRSRPGLAGAAGAAAVVVMMLGLRAMAGPGWTAAAVAVTGVVGLTMAYGGRQRVSSRSRVSVAGACAALVASTLFSAAWVGSTSPRVEWFGALTWHGPRDQPFVAITFDDGPNETATLALADILEAHGTRGTFFEVGKAVAREPEVTRQLVARGHTVGNHSYNHHQWSYLNPTYPELNQTQAEISGVAGVCPALFRPPHGTHAPSLSREVSNANMHLVTWDVSAKDWAETDSHRLAAAIVAKARPGSIILLHDSIDGDPAVDRSVVVAALPAILEGLAAKGLQPVTLDRLLGVEPYLKDCGRRIQIPFRNAR